MEEQVRTAVDDAERTAADTRWVAVVSSRKSHLRHDSSRSGWYIILLGWLKRVEKGVNVGLSLRIQVPHAESNWVWDHRSIASPVQHTLTTDVGVRTLHGAKIALTTISLSAYGIC